MYALSQIRNRVNALQRKFATELKILRVFPIAEEFALDWACCRFSATIYRRFSRSLTHPLGAVIKTFIRFPPKGQFAPLLPSSFR